MLRSVYHRELLDHLTSLRFALVLVVSVVLMGLNGILTAGGGSQTRISKYIASQERRSESLVKRAAELSELGAKGPGRLQKRPSALAFCAGGRDDYLPGVISASYGATYGGNWGMIIYEPWYLKYDTPAAPPRSGIVAEFVEIDWVFIVGLVLSLMAILLTFDAISGDRQAGTLQLTLGGAVPRSAVLGGKFLGALTVLLVALGVGVGLNLLVIVLLGTIDLHPGALIKMAAMLAAAVLYLCFFLGLGLLVSARSERPASGLVVLLLVWTVLVFLLPNTMAGVISSLGGGQGLTERDRQAAIEENWVNHGIRALHHAEADGRPPYGFVERISDFVSDWFAINRRFAEAFLQQELAHVELGRDLSRGTPYGVFQYAMESLADTGLPRHRRFIEAARRYEGVFRAFVESRDRADGDSYHLAGVTAGLSHQPVPEEIIPRFREDLSAGASIGSTAPDLLILLLFAVAAYMAAHLAFVHREIA